jgi:DNA repair protein RecN (Recombination protein N)
MLEEIRIRDLGVIEDATVELDPGLTVLTGETGAGKTMVVSALTWLLGARSDAALVRAGASRALIEGRWRLPSAHPAVQRAVAGGAELDDDGALIAARSVAANGRSRSFLGGAAVPVSVLAEIGADLVAVHGQSDQLALLAPARQRAALDAYGGAKIGKVLDAHREAYRRWQALDAELRERAGRVRELRQEADLLRHGLAEIAEVDPQPAEDEALAAEAARLSNLDVLREAAQGALDALALDAATLTGEAADAGALAAAARHSLQMAGDPELTALAERLDEVVRLIADVAAELASYLHHLSADPDRLAAVHERRAILKGLTRKYAESVDGVLAWADQARARLGDLDVSDDALGELAAQRDAARGAAERLADDLTKLRTAAATRFARAVTAELGALAMPDSGLTLEITPRPLGPDGADDVAMLLAAHRGAPARPVQRSASGGELSRVMLGIEAVFADADPIPTMVFDEVDAGVGGAAAIEVGRRLARLARGHQVIVVTHLPQVAAFADRHVVVAKDRSGAVTRTGVRAVADAARSRELARMLAGLADSELGQAHAEELLAAAAER